MSEKVKRITKQYTKEYKAEAVKLVREIGTTKAAIELGVPKSTLSQWVKRAEIGDLDNRYRYSNSRLCNDSSYGNSAVTGRNQSFGKGKCTIEKRE